MTLNSNPVLTSFMVHKEVSLLSDGRGRIRLAWTNPKLVGAKLPAWLDSG
jgi:hypothetical protein